MQKPTALCLHTLNQIGPIIEAEVKMRVCELEQQQRDALDKEFFSYADQLKHASRELDLLRYKLSSAITAVFLDELKRQELERPAPTVAAVEVVEPAPEVELPPIPAKARTLKVVPNQTA